MRRDRQQPGKTLALAGGMAALLVLLVASLVLWHGAEDERSADQAARIKAKEQAKIAKDQRPIAQSAQGVAEKQADAAQHALTDSFFRIIGVSNGALPTREEREALWELAQLDRAEVGVRSKVLDRWFGTGDAFERGEARGGQGFRAAIGLNVEYHRLASTNAAELGRRFAAALEDPQKTDPYRLLHLEEVLGKLANNLEPQAAAQIAKDLALVVQDPRETDSFRLSQLGKALAALANKMEPQAAAQIARRVASRLVSALDNPRETDSDRLSELGKALAALTNKMEPQAAALIARRSALRLVSALEKPQETDSFQLSELGEALVALADKLEPQVAAQIAKPGAQRLSSVFGTLQETNPYQLSELGGALAALANKYRRVDGVAKCFQGVLFQIWPPSGIYSCWV